MLVQIVQILIAVGAPVLTNLLLALVGLLIGAGANALRKRANSDVLDAAISRVEQISKGVVDELNQTLVERMKEASADGSLTKEEARSVLQIAIQKVLTRMDNRSVTRLQKELGSEGAFLGLVRTNLEAAVNKAKK